MATHSSILAWRIPWTEGPGGLQSMGLLGVGHDWAASLSLFTFMHWKRKWQPTPVFLAWRSPGTGKAAVYGAAQSRTLLKWLSSSSSSSSVCKSPSWSPNLSLPLLSFLIFLIGQIKPEHIRNHLVIHRRKHKSKAAFHGVTCNLLKCYIHLVEKGTLAL